MILCSSTALSVHNGMLDVEARKPKGQNVRSGHAQAEIIGVLEHIMVPLFSMGPINGGRKW